MTATHAMALALIGGAMVLFVWGRWRHDLVALIILLAGVGLGIVPPADAFLGFGQPAVVTVAAVLILSSGLASSGTVDRALGAILPERSGPTGLVLTLCLVSAVLSTFMNNIGALALTMPLALQSARRNGIPPAKVLMPLAFGSILGGMVTLIGTPPNLIVAGVRARLGEESFGMFDFAPVGLAVAAAGIAYLVLVGWRLVPVRHGAGDERLFDLAPYLAEVRVREKSPVSGRALHEIEELLGSAEAQVLGIVHGDQRVLAPGTHHAVLAGDILLVEADIETLKKLVDEFGLDLVANADAGAAGEAGQEEKEKPKAKEGNDAEALSSEEVAIVEAVVLPTGRLDGGNARQLRLRTLTGINLLAVSREGKARRSRLQDLRLAAGDVLLLQGDRAKLQDMMSAYGCAPLAERSLNLDGGRKALEAGLIFIAAVLATAFAKIPAPVAFVAAAVLFVIRDVVPIRRAYSSIDWSVVVLLGAMMTVAQAVDATGATTVIVRMIVDGLAKGNPVVALGIIMIVTMTLSDVMNNAATAAVMAPIAATAANHLGVASDPFLMAVAVGASCAFLTPIGHQNNLLVLGPGGYHFGDYWRMGLPLEILVIAASIPMILIVWPL